MDLPTLLVIIFLLNGNIYQEVAVAPSMEVCNKVQLEAKAILTKSLGREPEAFATTCMTLKPVLKDA